MRLLVLLALLVACHREVKQEVRVAEATEEKTAKTTEESEVETKTKAPSDVDINTTSEVDAVIVEIPDGGVEVAQVVPNRPLSLPAGSRVVGTVRLSSKVRVEAKHVGAVVDNKVVEKKVEEAAVVVKKVDASSRTDTVTEVGLDWKLYGLLFLCFAGLLVAGYLLVKRLL